jgi:hypothetical protein
MANGIKMIFLINICLIMIVLGFFHNQMRAKELKRCLSSQSQVLSGLDESKADKLTLESILGCFHSLDESQRCSPDPELFSQPDESKRAEKTLKLAILNLFRLG